MSVPISALALGAGFVGVTLCVAGILKLVSLTMWQLRRGIWPNSVQIGSLAIVLMCILSWLGIGEGAPELHNAVALPATVLALGLIAFTIKRQRRVDEANKIEARVRRTIRQPDDPSRLG